VQRPQSHPGSRAPFQPARLRWPLILGASLVTGLPCPCARAAEDEAAAPSTRLCDTGAVSAQPLSSATLRAQRGWTTLPEDDLTHRFRGDAVIRNDTLGAVLRGKADGLEVYSITTNGCQPRVTLVPLMARGAAPAALSGVKILENNPGAVLVEAVFQSGDGAKASLTCRLSAGQGILEVRPSAGVARLRLQVASRYVVVPDFFGDDMVFTPNALPGTPITLPRTRITLPTENLCLTPLDHGHALLMCVWQSSRLGAEATIVGSMFAGVEVECLSGKSLWLSVLEGAGLWHEQPLTAESAKTPLVLDWKPPFPGKWRADLVGPRGVARSSYFRGRPETDEDLPLATAQSCSCRWEGERAVVHGPASEESPSGWPYPRPLLIYAMDRTRATPLTAFCPIDVLRNTLGVGPCQYILQTEGLATDSNPTPGNVMTWIEKQFSRKRQQKSADEIRDLLKQMTEHVGHAGQRIQRYGDLARDVRKLCTGSEPSSSARSVAALSETAEDLQRAVTSPDLTAAPERASQLAAQVAGLIEQTSGLAECQRLGAELRAVGGTQDRALANGRMAARWLRAQAKMLAADEPPVAALARQVQVLVDAALPDKSK
jgi:hypothetical protein